MALKLENINNLISDDLAKRNENWTEIDNTFELKADKATTYTKTEVDTSLGLKADKQQEEWITPTLLNGATADPDDPFKYRKNQMGVVETKGKIIVASTAPCFGFPLGYKTGTNKARRFILVLGEIKTAFVTILAGQVYTQAGTVDFNGFRFISEG